MSTPRYICRIEDRYLHKCMLTAALFLFILAKRWEKPKYPSTDKWIDKKWSIHTMEYYSAIKRNEVLIAATILNET